MNIKIHKPGCLANVSCLVIHPDGICPGPYGKCTCDSMSTIENKECDSHLRDEFEKVYKALNLREETISGIDEKGMVHNLITFALSSDRQRLYEEVGKVNISILDGQISEETPTAYGFNRGLEAAQNIIKPK